jgi:hypothetical protein
MGLGLGLGRHSFSMLDPPTNKCFYDSCLQARAYSKRKKVIPLNKKFGSHMIPCFLMMKMIK